MRPPRWRWRCKLDHAYDAAKQRAGVLDFDDLIEHAQRLLQRADAAPWVLYKLDGGLDHILIDEGQDTSPAQWESDRAAAGRVLRRRAARASASRTMFAVGDPKQSIYGFQGADPRSFPGRGEGALQARPSRWNEVRGARSLETSFRSSPEILQAVDATFADKPLVRAPPARFDVIRPLGLARQRTQASVEVWPLAMRRRRRGRSPGTRRWMSNAAPACTRCWPRRSRAGQSHDRCARSGVGQGRAAANASGRRAGAGAHARGAVSRTDQGVQARRAARGGRRPHGAARRIGGGGLPGADARRARSKRRSGAGLRAEGPLVQSR